MSDPRTSNVIIPPEEDFPDTGVEDEYVEELGRKLGRKVASKIIQEVGQTPPSK